VKRFLIPMELIRRNELLTKSVAIESGILRLWNKNSLQWSTWRIIRKSLTHFALIVERGNCPRYWRRVIIPDSE